MNVETFKHDNVEIRLPDNGDDVVVELWYPRSSSNPRKHIEIDLVDLRASDGIRVLYDYDRDGWVIQQPYTVADQENANTFRCREVWEETAFVQSWALQHKSDTPWRDDT